MITRCHRCDQDRCTECTPTLLCNGCLGVDPQVKTCLDCEQPFCLFCSDDYGNCKECLGAICADCWYLSNRSLASGACRPCFSPPAPKEPEDHPLPDGFTVSTLPWLSDQELRLRNPRPDWQRKRKPWTPPWRK